MAGSTVSGGTCLYGQHLAENPLRHPDSLKKSTSSLIIEQFIDAVFSGETAAISIVGGSVQGRFGGGANGALAEGDRRREKAAMSPHRRLDGAPAPTYGKATTSTSPTALFRWKRHKFPVKEVFSMANCVSAMFLVVFG